MNDKRIRKYKLEELLAQVTPENIPPFVDWGPDVGAEIIDDDYSRGLIRPPDDIAGRDAAKKSKT